MYPCLQTEFHGVDNTRFADTIVPRNYHRGCCRGIPLRKINLQWFRDATKAFNLDGLNPWHVTHRLAENLPLVLRTPIGLKATMVSTAFVPAGCKWFVLIFSTLK